MFSFFQKKSQPQRVLDLLLKKGTVTSLELSQMHPVILNFHECIHDLRQKHEIETITELVKGIKHTSYKYKGRLVIPFKWECSKKITEEEAKSREEIAYEQGYNACKIQYDLFPKKRGRPFGSKNK